MAAKKLDKEKFSGTAAYDEAEELGLTEEDFEGIEPSGSSGDYLKSDVTKAAKNRDEAQKSESESSDGDGPVSGTVPSPTGPQPVSAVARNKEEARKLLEEQPEDPSEPAETSEEARKTGKRVSSVYTELDEEHLERMSAAEIRAVATDRGYDLGPRAGRHRTKTAFMRAQEEDEYLGESDEDDESDK